MLPIGSSDGRPMIAIGFTFLGFCFGELLRLEFVAAVGPEEVLGCFALVC